MAMRCHYEVLNLDLNCNSDEIKKSYKKLALKWHPDKNLDCPEECAKQFLLVKQAYDVLFDPQERAWYDKHRESILRGGLGNSERYQDNSLDLFAYFRTSCYKGFHDGPQGFYQIYADVFRKLYEEEIEFMEDEDETPPEFGNSKSSYEEVVRPFYGYWEGFCTAKSYDWVDKYNTSTGFNRQERRFMEQENKRLRNKARKERNEEVRALAAYVRKRDLRVQEYKKKQEERAAEVLKLTEEKRQNEKKKKLERMENYKESEWSAFSGLAEELEKLERELSAQFGDDNDEYDDDGDDDIGSNDTEEGIDTEVNELKVDGETEGMKSVNTDGLVYLNEAEMLYCVSCDKSFKSINALKNHKKSRKHLVNESLFMDTMMAESGHGESCELTEADVEVKVIKEDDSTDEDTLDDLVDEGVVEVEEVLEDDDVGEVVKDQVDTVEKKIQNEDEKVDDKISKKQKQKKKNSKLNRASDEEVDGSTGSGDSKPQLLKTDKYDKKVKTSGNPPATSSSIPAEFICNVCRFEFPTRNKLFEHIKAAGHALHVGSKETQNLSKKQKSKKSSKLK